MEVPKPFRHATASTLCLAFASYLGYAFSDVFLKALLPASLMAPSVFVSSIGFFFVLRWLGQKPANELPITEYSRGARLERAPQGFTMWESLYHPEPLLKAHALSELIELLEQSHSQGDLSSEQFDSIVARATQKSKHCTSPQRGDVFNLDNDSHLEGI